MKKIKLSRGLFAKVDNKNYLWLSKYKWHALKCRNVYYATRSVRQSNGKPTGILMHREILHLERGDKRQGDHRDWDTLNNCEDNLRICTHGENLRNQGPQKRHTSSIFKGVSFHKARKKWQSHIKVDGVLKYLGAFKNERVAALIYDLNARKYHKEFAVTNF